MLVWANWVIIIGSVAGFAAFLYSVLRRDKSKVYLGMVGGGGIVLAGTFSAVPGTSESLNVSRALFSTLPWLLPLTVYGFMRLTLGFSLSKRLQQALLVCGAFSLIVYLALGSGVVTRLTGDKPLSYSLTDPQLLALNSPEQELDGYS